MLSIIPGIEIAATEASEQRGLSAAAEALAGAEFEAADGDVECSADHRASAPVAGRRASGYEISRCRAWRARRQAARSGDRSPAVGYAGLAHALGSVFECVPARERHERSDRAVGLRSLIDIRARSSNEVESDTIPRDRGLVILVAVVEPGNGVHPALRHRPATAETVRRAADEAAGHGVHDRGPLEIETERRDGASSGHAPISRPQLQPAVVPTAEVACGLESGSSARRGNALLQSEVTRTHSTQRIETALSTIARCTRSRTR